MRRNFPVPAAGTVEAGVALRSVCEIERDPEW